MGNSQSEPKRQSAPYRPGENAPIPGYIPNGLGPEYGTLRNPSLDLICLNVASYNYYFQVDLTPWLHISSLHISNQKVKIPLILAGKLTLTEALLNSTPGIFLIPTSFPENTTIQICLSSGISRIFYAYPV